LSTFSAKNLFFIFSANFAKFINFGKIIAMFPAAGFFGGLILKVKAPRIK
jgi:hypothetical protein